jgi:hypothetical protein
MLKPVVFSLYHFYLEILRGRKFLLADRVELIYTVRNTCKPHSTLMKYWKLQEQRKGERKVRHKDRESENVTKYKRKYEYNLVTNNLGDKCIRNVFL